MPFVALLVAAAGAAGAAAAADFDEPAWRRGVEAERAEFLDFLRKSPTSYFAAVGRVDFGPSGALEVGSAEGVAVRLDGPSVKPHHLRAQVQGDVFRVRALDEGATFATKEGDMREAVVAPSTVRVGSYVLRLSHQRFPAIVTFDPRELAKPPRASPRWWPPDPAWRAVARLMPAPGHEEAVVLSTRGMRRRVLRLGTFEFEVHGHAAKLEANRFLEPGVDENEVTVLFRDATTGRESYPVGRYLDPKKLPDGRWVLDFNSAYNPACAYSPHYNCPIPPPENRLSFAVEAGEKSPEHEGETHK